MNSYLTPQDAIREGFLTANEVRELQQIADKYRTTFYVVGSRANGKGRNIGHPNLPVGKNPIHERSDIDIRIDGQVDIDSGGRFSNEISNSSNGAGSPLMLHGDKPDPPAIVFKSRN